ncbi:DUF2750 domain-containing protein [Candidatus Albibeggiatoa sp. nov. NOAA]|uniref:DUF2750 domain-containing protein n=1 Tax=Candidatus Albibeggiatoa sp. nov. NOAA TaxID=3162724 RepID=UPI0032FA7B95|nr:DUF2750 domain-containing protein [Thiotrichaceae bacterium]
MPLAPNSEQQAAFAQFSAQERIEYFLTRTMEAEEVWVHADDEGWLMREEDDKTILPVWPYENLARANLIGGMVAQATSLEHFIDILNYNRNRGIDLDIMPLPDQPIVIAPVTEILSMYESLIDSGSYFLEG